MNVKVKLIETFGFNSGPRKALFYRVCRIVSTALLPKSPPNSSPGNGSFLQPHRIDSHKTPANMHHTNKSTHY